MYFVSCQRSSQLPLQMMHGGGERIYLFIILFILFLIGKLACWPLHDEVLNLLRLRNGILLGVLTRRNFWRGCLLFPRQKPQEGAKDILLILGRVEKTAFRCSP